MTTIASYSFPHEAHIAKALLESEGIAAIICDEHTINMQWLYSQALGGVRVQVADEQAERAREILDTDYSQELEAIFPAEAWHCSHCGSEDVELIKKGQKAAFLMIALLDFSLWRTQKRLLCHQCGRESACD